LPSTTKGFNVNLALFRKAAARVAVLPSLALCSLAGDGVKEVILKFGLLGWCLVSSLLLGYLILVELLEGLFKVEVFLGHHNRGCSWCCRSVTSATTTTSTSRNAGWGTGSTG
jgi:hypothetical protein